jgi:hypothetical protein
MIVAEERRSILIALNKFFLLEFKKILWKHGISAQEFLSYIIRLFVTGDQRLHNILVEAKKAKAEAQKYNLIHTDEESLYSLIEHNLKLEQQKKEQERG